MAKQFVIDAMEEVLGEYILNIPKESLSIAALKGEVRLENVQLDGDLVGSHFFGMVGITSFGVLSCSAKSIRISLPWKQLEKEPTRFEVEGVHLVCVPLTPTTANLNYGSGSVTDPRCSLRTRAKRLALARYERFFWNGQIPGEGPPLKRVKRAVKDVERVMKQSKRQSKQKRGSRLQRSESASSLSLGSSQHSTKSKISYPEEYSEMEEALDELVYSISTENQKATIDDDSSAFSSNTENDEFPNLPRDWKVKLREKAMRNLEATMKNVHIRCEVPQPTYDTKAESDQRKTGEKKGTEETAFAFGFTLDSLVVRTANENWEVGSHDTRNPVDGSRMSSVKDNLGPNEYMVVNNKIGFFNGLSLYWDDDPPVLLSKTDALKGIDQKLSSEKVTSLITEAMESLYYYQDISPILRESLSINPSIESPKTEEPHSYICKSLNTEVRVRTSDRQQPGPISCSADVLPFEFTFDFLPHQIVQYQRLKSQILAQQRFDTMRRPRPSHRPTEDPHSWWKYAISCVMSRPNSRPWEDILPMVQIRGRYMDLIMKKNSRSSGYLGYHSGLKPHESQELLRMEDLLPIEALLAFHTVALRKAYVSTKKDDASVDSKSASPRKERVEEKAKSARPLFRLPRIATGGGKKKAKRNTVQTDELVASSNNLVEDFENLSSSTKSRSPSLLDAMNLRLGKKVWFVDWKLHDAVVNIQFRLNRCSEAILEFVLRGDGRARSFGFGKRDFFFDITQFDVLHQNEKVLFVCPVADDTPLPEGKHATPSRRKTERKPQSKPDMKTPSTFIDLPPPGSVFRVIAGKNMDSLKLSASAHPATLVWTTSLLKGISDFVSNQSPGSEYDLAMRVRNAATPLARKAQLALLSPASMSLHLNIVAPKVWVSLASNDKHGTLFIDAGTVKIASVKCEGETDPDWDFHARDIGVTFVEGIDPTRLGVEGNQYLRAHGVNGRVEKSVVRPLSIEAKSRRYLGSSPIDGNSTRTRTSTFREAIRRNDIVFSPITFNLVDADILARSFGKWYAIGLGSVKRRVLSADHSKEKIRQGDKIHNSYHAQMLNQFGPPRTTSIKIQKLEIAIEGHSKKPSSSTDDASMISLETLLEHAPASRAYFVEIFDISMTRTTTQLAETTTLSFQDASIVRPRDVMLHVPMKLKRTGFEWENCVLSRETNKEKTRRGIFRATLCHNRSMHTDEVEVDIDSVILRVTPTTLKDCAKAFRRIAELAQIVTKEMERKVHEEGRRARRRDRRGNEHEAPRGGGSAQVGDRPVSPSMSDTMTDISLIENSSSAVGSSDSSILFRVTVSDCTILAGKPTTSLQSDSSPRTKTPLFVVIQIVSNALIMFQSIENPDASGSKTLHVSVDDLSVLLNREFKRVSLNDAPPMIEPTGAEFRIVYSTENFGCVVSQDISIDCEAVKSYLTPNDLYIIINISRTMFDRLRAFGGEQEGPSSESVSAKGLNRLSSLVRYKKKGTGIATRLSAEVQTFSFVLLQAYTSHSGAPEFLDFNVKEIKAAFEGCLSALSGEFSGVISVNFFNSDIRDWEYAVEPFPLTVEVEQMPTEVMIVAAPSCPIQLNVTGIFLRVFSEMQFDILRNRPSDSNRDIGYLNPSAVSTIGLRRASERRLVKIQNSTGLDLLATIESSDCDNVLLLNGSLQTLRFCTDEPNSDQIFLSLQIATSAVKLIGERNAIHRLPVAPGDKNSELYLLKPSLSLQNTNWGKSRQSDGRNSPDSTLSLTPEMLHWGYYNAEPVVEWCMQNQRLRPNITDIFSLPKGRDLLSNRVWSPEDELRDGIVSFSGYDLGGKEYSRTKHIPSPEQNVSNKSSSKYNWLTPYQSEDSHEWTDMTCNHHLNREQFMLPDNKWMWVNDWSVELDGKLGKDIDADGWSYSTDFETFSSKKQFYHRGAACRRRLWTRTRILKPPKFDDPCRQVKLLWESFKNPDGTFAVHVSSHLRVVNNTPFTLAVFAFSPSWNSDKHVGTATESGTVHISALFASATHLRIARKTGVQENVRISDCLVSDRFMIIPSSYTSSRFDRTFIDLNDVSNTTLHFVVEVRSECGSVSIIIEPVCRLVNLLPCQLECNFGECTSLQENIFSQSRSRKCELPITKKESLAIQSGRMGAGTAVSPWCKPHISFRVPGYKWSMWYRIVNASTDTWRPSENEEEFYFNLKETSNDHADEIKTLIRFERFGKGGDPLVVIMTVECGHTPVIRVFAQYWILDKTGFGCRFSEGFVDMMGTVPDPETSRRSYLATYERGNSEVKGDMALSGHQWSIGQSGMTLYFSKKQKLTLSLETGISRNKRTANPRSTWISPLDVSNVIPKTVFSVDELGGTRRFELAIYVTQCSGVFSRTKMITLLPRYQIVNLLHRELIVCQDGCPEAKTFIPARSSMPFHWENASLESKIRLGTPSVEQRAQGNYDKCWTNGKVQVDRVGITSMRLPTPGSPLVNVPMVVQTEVRLATLEQPSAVVIVIWSGDEKSNPLYMLRNRTNHTILCRQVLSGDQVRKDVGSNGETLPAAQAQDSGLGCGLEIGPILRSYLGLQQASECWWTLKGQESACFGLEDPEKPHVIEWSCAHAGFPPKAKVKAQQDIDAMGSFSIIKLPGNVEVQCLIRAEHSTKVIEFVEASASSKVPSSRGKVSDNSKLNQELGEITAGISHQQDEDESVSISLRVEVPSLSISVIDNANREMHGREILLCHFEKTSIAFSHGRERYHEFELRLTSFQIDNHVPKSVHPILIFCPRVNEKEPLLHMSAVVRHQLHSDTRVFRYAAIRLLDVEIFLDRRTAETIARFIQPLMNSRELDREKSPEWLTNLTGSMHEKFETTGSHASRNTESMLLTANSGRIYFEQLHLHPVRLSLTFTQEWIDWNQSADTVMIFQFIRGMASIANAPLVFTSFFVGHVFEAPQALLRIIGTHYSSQLTKQIFGILGSLAILGAPADFISNVGTGVIDFFYEPIQGAVHGPRQFIEGLEAGTQSLARGIFVGVVRGAANVGDVVNSNLAGLTADDDFIGERQAYRRMLTDARSRGIATRTFVESLNLACASFARGVKSGAVGIVEQPSRYASKHGPVGLLKGIGKAALGAVVKPVVGLGDGVVLVMNHMSDATSKQQVLLKIPKRLRRALPSRAAEKPNCVSLEPYDERSAKAQTIVTGGDTVDDVYLGHVNLHSHLIIASEQCLWAIDRVSCDPWCVSWREISHFRAVDGSVRVVVFSQTGLKTYVFQVDSNKQLQDLQKLLSLQLLKMANHSEINYSVLDTEPENSDDQRIPGIKSVQVNHIFGSYNNTNKRLSISVKNEFEIVEQCFNRVRKMGSDQPAFLKALDEEAWNLVSSCGQFFSGLNARRCVVASIINGSGHPIQIKSSKLAEGGSPCYSIPTKEFDSEQGILHPGGVILFFGWGIIPNLVQAGSVFISVETNAFICDLVDQKSRPTLARAMPGYQVGFLEKSYDDSGWWAKYWLIVRCD